MTTGAGAVAVVIMRSGNKALSRLLRTLHPEGKHLACRHRQQEQQTISETPIAKRLRRTVITEMIAADIMRMMSLSTITSNVHGQNKTWLVQTHRL